MLRICWIPYGSQGYWRQPGYCWAKAESTNNRSPVCYRAAHSHAHLRAFQRYKLTFEACFWTVGGKQRMEKTYACMMRTSKLHTESPSLDLKQGILLFLNLNKSVFLLMRSVLVTGSCYILTQNLNVRIFIFSQYSFCSECGIFVNKATTSKRLLSQNQ